MPRVHQVKKARKDNPAVKAGESYYYWEFRTGPKQYSATYPRQSQLTQSKMSAVYAALESVEDSYKDVKVDTVCDIENALEEASSNVREVAEEYRESAEAIREHFSESPTADECDEKADELDTLADELEQFYGESIGNIEPENLSEEDYIEEIQGTSGDIPSAPF